MQRQEVFQNSTSYVMVQERENVCKDKNMPIFNSKMTALITRSQLNGTIRGKIVAHQ